MPDKKWLPIINLATCTGCGECVESCPTDALSQEEQDGKAFLAFPDSCTYCAVCEAICPVEAIELPLLICRAGDES